MMGIAGEIVLPREAKPQPHPEIHVGGDCGACVLGGALNIDVQEVYKRFDSTGITHSGEMARCLRCASSYELADRIITSSAEWPDEGPWRKSFGRPADLEYLAWFNYVRMAIDAGYYGIACVRYDESVPEFETNHYVLIRGARTEGAVTGKVMTGEVLVSCSASRLNGWHEAKQFLKHKGGYDLMFVRPNN